MSILLHARPGTSAQQALSTLAHRQVQVKLRLPQLPGSGNAECDNAEMLGNIVKKGGGAKEVSGFDSRLSGGNSLSPVLVKKGWVDGGANNVQKA